ncbi:DUF1643 domain-containing protein [Peribacillus simplex]|nr:DUF1643 domain-containing protein [Peribacillus simplex]
MEYYLDEIQMDAIIDETGEYRYSLFRGWDRDLPRMVFIMLNPSTANHYEDDPTIRRCISFAKLWGYGSFEVVNLFAYRATNPKELSSCKDPIGKDNDKFIIDALKRADLAVAAWGTKGKLYNRNIEVLSYLTNFDLFYLSLTKEGHPKHPLYIKSDEKLKKLNIDTVTNKPMSLS